MRNNTNRILYAGLLGALWSGASAEGKLTDLSYQKAGQGVLIQAQGQNLPKPKVLRMNGNRSYMLEFAGTSLADGFKRIRVHYGGVQYATAGWFTSKPPVVRVHLWLRPNLKPELSQNEKGWLVSVNAPVPQTAAKLDGPAESFPTRVPPLEKATAKAAQPIGQTVKVYEEPGQPSMPSMPIATAPKAAAPAKQAKPIYVTLDFSGTEVVQIIKALAMQSGVNIIAGPEVQGKINVTLKKVELTEALDYVTTLAGLRYAKIGKTYVVTSSARFAEAMQQLAGKLEDAGETRVVQLSSGEGTQIKAAVLKAVPQYTSKGSYDVILPSEEIEAKTTYKQGSDLIGQGIKETKSETTVRPDQDQRTSTTNEKSGASDTGKAGDSNALKVTGSKGSEVNLSAVNKIDLDDNGIPKQRVKDPYLVVVGSPERISEVINFISRLDKEVALAANVGPNRDIATRAVPVYSGETDRISEALQSIINRDPRANVFKLSSNMTTVSQKTVTKQGGKEDKNNNGETTKTTTAFKMPTNPVIIVTGPKDALDSLVEIATTLDKSICNALDLIYPKKTQDGEKVQRLYEVIGLNYVDPAQASSMLQKHIPRLSVDFIPGGVGTMPSTSSASKTSDGEDSQTSKSMSPDSDRKQYGSESKNGNTSASESTPMQILVYGTAEEIAAAKKLLATVDVPAKQIALELRVMEMSKEDALKVGLDWSLFTGGTLKSIRINQGLSAGPGTVGSISGGTTTEIGDKSSIGTTLPGLDFGGGDTLNILGKLDQLNDSNKLISRPNILATDGRRTRIFIGDTVRYVESIQSSQNGVTVTSKELNVGVEMKLLARVGADNSINLDLNPSLTLLKGFTTVPGGGSLPQTSTREANTQMTIKDGETIAIGGLIQQQDIKTIGGIPLLRDIPLLGELFKRTETNKIKKEVVFFLTAKVVDNSNRAYAANPKANEGLKLPEPPTAK